MSSLKIKRGSYAQLVAAAAADQLKEGEPYLISDQGRIAIGTSTSTFEVFAKLSEVAQNTFATLQQEIDALKAVVAGMPKYKEYQAGYIPRANFVGTLANNALITANYPKPFSKRPILKVMLDIKDAAAVRAQYVNNATETGFQVATNYASSLIGVWYEAFILEN